jgi:5'-nucleotidase
MKGVFPMNFQRPVRASIPSLLLAMALAGCATPQRAPIELNLVAINDFHGNLEPSKYSYKSADGKTQTLRAGGIEAMSGALAAWRREDKDLLVVAAGDLVGASPAISSMWADEPSIEAMNMLGLSASALGNHEFDAGRKELLRQQNGGCDSPRPDKACQLAPSFGGASFKYLATNVHDVATNAPLVPGWRIETVKGVKVGIVGTALEATPTVAVASAIAGLSFGDEAQGINQAVAQMRAQGVRVFVVLIHNGFHGEEVQDQSDCSKLTGRIADVVKNLDPAVRLVISGHSHIGYVCKVDGRVVTQGASAGHLLTRISMKVDPASGDVSAIDARNVIMKPGEFQPDPRVSGYLAKVKERAQAQLARPVARLGVAAVSSKENAAGESPLGDLIADAAVEATREQGVQLGFMNPGGIRKDLEAGPDLTATYGQAQAVLPFGNTLVVMDMTGAQIRNLLEQQWLSRQSPYILQVSSGLSYRWDEKRPVGSRVVPGSVRINGAALEDGRTYRVVANNFLAEGGDKFPEFAKGANRADTQIRDLDGLIAYLKKRENNTQAATLAPVARIEKVQ